MSCKTCPTCSARWVDGQHYWATGKRGSELDLAGLVCNLLSDSKVCVNPCRGQDGGDTWAKRNQRVSSQLEKLDES